MRCILNKQTGKRKKKTFEQEEPHDNADVVDELFSFFSRLLVALAPILYPQSPQYKTNDADSYEEEKSIDFFFPLFFVSFLFSFVYIALISEILTVHTRWMHNLAVHALCSVEATVEKKKRAANWDLYVLHKTTNS